VKTFSFSFVIFKHHLTVHNWVIGVWQILAEIEKETLSSKEAVVITSYELLLNNGAPVQHEYFGLTVY
jgi:hypothetical protein